MILIRKWLEDTGLITVNKHPDEWVTAGVVFTRASWVMANECCMEVFDGPAKLVEYIRKNNTVVLSANEIDRIATLFTYPRIARAYINREIKTLYIDNEPGIVAETGASYQASGNNQPKVKEGKAKKAKSLSRSPVSTSRRFAR